MKTPDWQLRVRDARVRRAMQRRHRPCQQHGPIRTVCRECSRINCPSCTSMCMCGALLPPVARPKRAISSNAPAKPALQFPVKLPAPVARLYKTFLQPRGCIGVTPHPESGAWMALFPFRLPPHETASQLLEAIEAAAPEGWRTTPFGAGRLSEPERWFVTFYAPNSGTAK